MAKLLSKQFELTEYDIEDFDNWNEKIQEEEEEFEEVRENNPVIRFGVADGYAWYKVVELNEDTNEEPVLQHIPYMDAYQIPAAHIRGLRTEDVKQKLNQINAIKERSKNSNL